MSVLNDMLRNLESRGAAADVPALAAGARPAAPGFVLKPARGSSGRVWIWSATAFVVAGVVAGLMWQERQAGNAHERRKPLGWSTYGTAIAQNAHASVAAAATTVALADASPEPRSVVAEASAVVPTAITPVASRMPASVASVAVVDRASAGVMNGGQASAGAAKPRAVRRALPVAAAPADTDGGESRPGADAASISITASASKDRNTAADIARAGELIARGRNSEAVPLLAQVLTREPAQSQARAALVALFAENGQRERALALLLDGAQIEPARFAASAAQLQAELGDAAGALATLERVPAARRTHAHYALAGGLAHRNRQFDLAVDAYGRAVASPDAPGVWWVGLALAHESLGQHSQARAAFVRATAHPQLPADVRSFVAARLQGFAVDTRRDGATVAVTAP